MYYNIISTGSQGNAVVVNNHILIDCGVTFKALKGVYKDLQIVLLTHIHTDHFKPKTLKRLAQERPTLRFGCCQWLVKPLVDAGIPKQSIDVYEIGKIYDYKAFKVSPIKLYHNVQNCGYRVFASGEKAIYATDTGHLQGITAKDYDLYMIEANYTDEDLQERINAKLEAGEYSYELNVASRHLSHEQASEWLMENMSVKSEYVFLHGHKDKKKPQEWEYADT
jgi:L-ascorbate metabolism protein UlaG (beta-lactamase superfamily)